MSDRQLIEAIQRLAGTHLSDEVYLVPCTVVSVDMDALTCDCSPIGGTAGTDLPNVALMAEVDDGEIRVPADNSVVLVMYSKRQKPFIALYSELAGIIINIGNSSFEIDGASVTINDGSYGGLVKISDLVTRLNNIENAFNLLNTKVNGLAPTPVIPPISVTTQPMIENTLVTHGK